MAASGMDATMAADRLDGHGDGEAVDAAGRAAPAPAAAGDDDGNSDANDDGRDGARGDSAQRHAPGTRKVEEIVVRGVRESAYDPNLEPTDSANLLDFEDLRRTQSPDVFDAVRDLPGVSVEGGPRTSGKRFAIRGFSDNEDVLVRIDGVTQNFEKYRYGAGVDIEPELLKQVAVHRGGAAITQGSGYLGGVVEMETVDAADLLAPGQRLGGQARLGYLSNNEGKLYSGSAYARPLDFLDALVNVTRRDSRDYELPDGSRFPDSAEAQTSVLGKLELSSDSATLGISHRRAEQSGQQPFDITGGITGIGGLVLRDTSEAATALRFDWDPATEWVALDATLGFIDKQVIDANSAIAGVDDAGNPVGTDRFAYQIWTTGIGNRARFGLGPTRHELAFGWQGNRERRVATRDNLAGNAFNPAQPSGEKRSHGVYALHRVRWGGLTVEGGLRRDWFDIAAGPAERRVLSARGEPDKVSYALDSPVFSIAFAHGPAEVFYHWGESFRVPLLDELFQRGNFSACVEFTAFARAPTAPVFPALPPQPQVSFPPTPQLADFGFDAVAWLAALDAWNAAVAQATATLAAWAEAIAALRAGYDRDLDAFEDALAAYLDDPNADRNAMCGDRYRPETATTREAGFVLDFDSVLHEADALSLKFTYYDIRVGNLIESIYEDSVTGAIGQPGREVRKGFEVEARYDQPRWYARFALTTLDGYIKYGFFANNVDPDIARFTDPGRFELFNVPADNFNLTLAVTPRHDLEIGHRLRVFAPRLVTVGFEPGCVGTLFTNPVCSVFGEQHGYMTSNFFLSWRPHPSVDLRLTVDNALNKEFQNTGFGGALGAIAPGRDIRASVLLRY
ncbi:MAG: TonB-dependent receptor [Gammaproteobacteria bacterium]